nr:hypothetical protein [Corynebacterium macginleyi]
MSAAAALSACSSDDEQEDTTKSTESSGSASADGQSAAPALPSAADLNAILAKATDPEASQEEKTATVEGGESAPEIFDIMARSKEESGAEFAVVDPVLPGYDPQSVLTTVNFSTADGQEQTADQVEFIYQDGTWKLSKTWACTLIQNTVPPEQVPQMCADTGAGALPADEAAGAPVVGEQQPPAEAPVEAPAQ